MTLSVSQIIGLAISIIGIAGLAIYSGTKPQTFANVNRAAIVAGIVMGTLVGGSSTVGTAQLAYSYGLSAWWFTLGGGIACLVLALVYAKPLRASGSMTLVGIISKEYGPKTGLAASVLSSVGTLINIISQLLAGTAVLAVVVPSLPLVPALIITAAFMALYVVFGGTQGAGRIGILKLALLYVSMIGCGVMVLSLSGGFGGFRSLLGSIDNPEGIHFTSLFARGVGKDAGACLSLVLGVLTTQTYAQAVMSGKSDAAARRGALISAFLIPPIGAGGILVGLYMRATCPGIAAKTALTAFTMEHMPGLLSGLVLGTLFIAVVGTGAGLTMGISTILRRDILQRFSDKLSDSRVNNVLSKLIIVAILTLGVCLSAGPLGDTILVFSFMSMGLRGAVLFIPMTMAIWMQGKVNRNWVLAAVIAGPVAVLLFGTVLPMPYGIDSLFAGVLVSFLLCAVGYVVGTREHSIRLMEKVVSIDSAGGTVIAVESEACSGSREIAEELARQLHIPCYDQEILEVAADISGIPLALLKKYEERPVRAAYNMEAESSANLQLPTDGDMKSAVISACTLLARRGPCVLLEHFSSLARKNCIRLFVHADFDRRAEVYAAEAGVGPATARKALKRIDRARARYYRSCNRNWGSASHYTIAIDSTNANPSVLAGGLIQYITNFAEKRKSIGA